MNKKFKKALQDSFMPPPPRDKERFIQQLEEKQNQRDVLSPLFFIRHSVWFRRSATVFCAIAVLGIGYDVYQTYTSGRQQLEITEPNIVAQTTDIPLETTAIVTTDVARTSASLSKQNGSYTDATNFKKTINTTETHFKESETESKSQQDTKQNNTTQETTITHIRETTVSKTMTTSKTVTSAKTFTSTRTSTKSKSTSAVQEEHSDSSPSTQVTAITAMTKVETTTRINFEPVPEQTSTMSHNTDYNDSPSVDTADYTVSPTITYATSDKIVRLEDLFEFAVDSNTDSIGKIYNSLSDLCTDATDIVNAYTQNVYYTSINGTPWIQIDVIIQNVYKSDTLHAGDKISIYLNGGYMPLPEFLVQNNLTLNMTDEEITGCNLLRWNDKTPLPTVGDTYLYFLRKGYSDLPNGSYMRIAENDSAQFSYTESSEFSSANPQSKISFSATTLLTTLRSLY